MVSAAKTREYEDTTKTALSALEHLLAPSPVKGRGSVLADMLRRSEEPTAPDGYRSQTRLGTPGNGSQVTFQDVNGETVDYVTLDSSTEAAMFRRAEDVCGRCTNGIFRTTHGRNITCKSCGGSGRRWADPVGDAVHDLLGQIQVMAKAAALIERHTKTVMGAADKWRGRVSTMQGTCCIPECAREVTGVGEDRLKQLYCPRCYLHHNSWKLVNRTDDPGADRIAFALFMAAKIAELAAKARERMERESEEITRLQNRRQLPTRR